MCVSFWRSGILGSSARTFLRHFQISLQTGLNPFRLWLILFTQSFDPCQSHKENWKKENFQFLKCKMYFWNVKSFNHNMSLVILHSLLVLLHFLYFSEVLTACCLRNGTSPSISHLAIHSAVPSNRSGVMMLVNEATEAAQYALLEGQK